MGVDVREDLELGSELGEGGEISSELESSPDSLGLELGGASVALPEGAPAQELPEGLRELLLGVLGLEPWEGMTLSDAGELWRRRFQMGAFDLLNEETRRLDPEWIDLAAERRRRLEQWALTPEWERSRLRQKKTWAEKGADLFLCGVRVRRMKHEEGDCNKSYFVPEHCRLRGCPVCGDKQADEYYDKWAPRLIGIARHSPMARSWRFEFRHITFTGPKPPRRPTPKEARKLWQKFLGTVADFCREFYPGSSGSSSRFPRRGGCGALIQGEVGRGPDGLANWNQHAHVIVFGPFYRVEELKERWRELTGASGYGIQIRRLGRDPEALSKTLHHMFKYYRKPFSYDPRTFVDTLLGMEGVRLRRATGLFHADRRGSTWGDRVREWEERARLELEALGKLRDRSLKCFDCGEVLVPDYRLGVMWREQAHKIGCWDYELTKRNRGSPGRYG